MTTKEEHRQIAEGLMAANKPLHALAHAVLAISADTEFMANLFTTPDTRPEVERTMVPAHILERQRANKNKCKCSDNPADIWTCHQGHPYCDGMCDPWGNHFAREKDCGV